MSFFKRPKPQLLAAWAVGIIVSGISISSGTYYGVESWFKVLGIPVIIIGSLIIVTLQVLPYSFESIAHAIKTKRAIKIGIILICVFIALIILVSFLPSINRELV